MLLLLSLLMLVLVRVCPLVQCEVHTLMYEV